MSQTESRPQDGAGYDLLVVGSGAGGLATAVTAAHLGLKAAVLEKAPVFGGTSAWSGGWLWVPRNPLATEAGIDEPLSGPMQYLAGIMGNRAGDPRIAQYLETGPEAIRFFRDETEVDWIDGNLVPDFTDSPGALGGGRSVCAAPYDGRALGPWIKRLRPPLGVISLAGMGIASGKDIRQFFDATRKPGAALYVAGRLLRHGRDLALHRRSMRRSGHPPPVRRRCHGRRRRGRGSSPGNPPGQPGLARRRLPEAFGLRRRRQSERIAAEPPPQQRARPEGQIVEPCHRDRHGDPHRGLRTSDRYRGPRLSGGAAWRAACRAWSAAPVPPLGARRRGRAAALPPLRTRFRPNRVLPLTNG